MILGAKNNQNLKKINTIPWCSGGGGMGHTPLTALFMFTYDSRYHEHDVEEDHPTCKEEYEEKCQQVTQGTSINHVDS